MTLLILNTLITTLFFSCMTSLSPVNLGITVLSIALIISALLSTITTRWFGFIIFIIYVGGILVIFAYFAALQPNQYITSWRWVITPSFFVILLITLSQTLNISWTPTIPNTTEVYFTTNIVIPILLALILFLALVIVVKTAHADEGPLRPFNYVQSSSKNSPRH